MDATNNIATDLFYKIRSRFTGLKLGESTGQITINPENARFFDFDYTENDKNIGHVSISLAEPNSMKVYFSNGITEGMDEDQKSNWYTFLKELRMFAKRRLLAFDTRDIAKDNLDKRDYAFLSQHSTPQSDNDTITKPVGETVMNESNLYGTKTQSFQKLLDTRLIIKHSKKLADDFEQKPGDRSRNIAALFVENQDGERFKYPFIHLAGARAMQRHVANGGLPYDAVGESIIKMSEEIAQLKSFTNYCVRNDLMNSDTNNIVERSKAQLDGLRERVARLSKQAHYENYVAEFQAPEAVEVPDDVMEEYKEKFTVKNFKEDIANAFPIIYKLMKEEESVGYDDIVGMSEADDNKEEKIKAWADKYEKYIGVNGDTLPEGWLEYQMDTGIPSDSIETGEYENYVEKHGEEAANDLGMDIVHDNPDEFPITNAFMDDLFDIMGGLGEEEAEEVNKVLGHFGENTQDPMAGFENWVNKLGEESPLTMADDEEKSDLVKKLNELIGQEFSAGVDGTNAITSLEGIIEDPKLEQDIKKKATEDANADIRPLVKAWVEENAPDVLDQLDFGDMADEPAVGADDVEPQQEEDANNEGLGDMFKKDPTLGMNKYGLAAIHKDGKFFSIKDKKITGEFDSLDELKKHQEELLNNEDSVSEGGNAWDLAVTTGMEIIQDSNDEDEAIKRLEDEITGSNEPDESYADMVIKDYIERIKKEGFDKVRHDMDAQDFMGDPVDLEMEGNEFSKKVQDLKAQGAKKGTKFKTSDGEEHTLEGLAEFINSFYDKNTGTFPKGPEGVCTMVGKKFGEQAEQVARKFVERMAPEQEQGAEDLEELERIKSLVNF